MAYYQGDYYQGDYYQGDGTRKKRKRSGGVRRVLAAARARGKRKRRGAGSGEHPFARRMRLARAAKRRGR